MRKCRKQTTAKGRWVAAVLLLGAVAVCASQTGCVQRRLTIRTTPPGALVYVDDYECGTTPTSINFTYYGTRKIRLVKDGCETMTIMQPVTAPWYEFPPIDFVAENLVPMTVHDRHELEFTLKPQVVVPPEQLLGKAEELRRGVQAGATVAPRPPRLARPPFDAPAPSSGIAPVPRPAATGVGSQPVYPLPQ